MSGFDLQAFANEVYYDMKDRRNRHLTDGQLATIEEQKAAGSWDDQAFTGALVNANDTYANDLVEGLVKGTDVEGSLQSLIGQIEDLGNKRLTKAVKELVTEAVRYDIQTSTTHIPTIHTNARFHLHDRIHGALYQGLQGNFDDLEEIADRGGDGGLVNDKADLVMARMEAHLAANPPQAETKTGLSAAAEDGFKPQQG